MGWDGERILVHYAREAKDIALPGVDPKAKIVEEGQTRIYN
jgi:hypothetical protein